MIENLGKVVQATITDKNEKKAYAQIEGVTFEISEPIEANIGDEVTGFIYINRHDKYKMTINPPTIQVDQLGYGTVVGTRRDLGVFVDIGLEDKDIVVSLDILPVYHEVWPNTGDTLRLSLYVDKENRMWGQLADNSDFIERSKTADKSTFNNDVEGIIYSSKKAGSHLFTDEHYIGFIHPSEREIEPRLGQRVKGRIIAVHPDGTVNVSLLPRAHEMIDDDAQMIYEVLKRSPDQRMPYWNKSDPDAIRDFFGISKAAFKRAYGNLLKQGLVTQEDGETILLKEKEPEAVEEKDSTEEDA